MNMFMIDNYLELVLDDIYEMITEQRVRWPLSLVDDRDKIEFMEEMILYFERTEEYELCAKLKEMIDGLENNSSIGREC